MNRKFMSPLTLGFIVSGILFFVIVAVVRSAMGTTDSIEQVTASGAQSFQQVASQQSSNQVLDALPEFYFEPVQPEALYAHVTVQDSLFPTDPEWLATAVDDIGRRWVWAGMWFDCPFVDNVADDFFIDELGAVRTRNLREVCHE